ncbi:MAG: T9SS type A sorting domain-containing protein [Mameliella sp.]|nr:T9SS type A sorting domain-containing protein [Phaeodactylibacter sp.]
MKHTILLFLCSVMGYTALIAQPVIGNGTFPQVGDSLRTSTDNLPSGIDLEDADADQSWDFTTLQSAFVNTTPVVTVQQADGYFGFPGADYAIIGDNANFFYRTTSGKVELLGFFGQDPAGLGIEGIFTYDPPLIERRAPLEYQDVNTSSTNISFAFSADDLPAQITDLLPISPDSIRIRLNSERTEEADAWGTLTIPGGIYDVLREKRTEAQQIRLDAKIGFFNWFDITDIVLELLQLDALEPQTNISYRYFSNEAMEPIAEVQTQNDGALVTNVTYKAGTISSLPPVETALPGVYAYPNPAIVNVRFEFANLPAGNYTVSIFNILGVREWSRQYYVDGSHTEKVDISSLRKGTYFYSIADSRGKTLVTKRLIVVRP